MSGPGARLGGRWRATRASGRRLALAALAAAAMSAAGCADRGSDIVVVYRGNVSSWRSRLRVTIDTGKRARVIVPSFPSAAKAVPVAAHGSLPVHVALLGAGGDTAARLTAPALALAPRTSYGVNIAVSAVRPAQTHCSGEWSATAVLPPATESLYVSITIGARGAPPARCDD